MHILYGLDLVLGLVSTETFGNNCRVFVMNTTRDIIVMFCYFCVLKPLGILIFSKLITTNKFHLKKCII